MPELLTFAYIPANHLKFNGPSQQPESRKDVFSDYVGDSRPTQYDENEHVLVLEMDDRMVRKRRPTTQVYLDTGDVSRVDVVDILARLSFRNLSALQL